MRSFVLASSRRTVPHFATALAIGVLVTVVSSGVTAQSVQVTVVQSTGTPAPPPWCSDPQPGPSGLMYVVCVDPEPIKTKAGPHNNVQITWNLDSGTGWMFPAGGGGIYIKKKKKWVVTPQSQTQYIATNTKENGSTKYRYTVNVIQSSYLLTFDPTIQN